MDAYAPGFSRYFLATGESDQLLPELDYEDELSAEREALEALVERVNAARTIV
ncbi:MAG TPA: hypothetical protein VNG69_05775 [Casimicrobiaceae bacterium]|nr:hypothetical protein [Casimicrobiaceae bacterium]